MPNTVFLKEPNNEGTKLRANEWALFKEPCTEQGELKRRESGDKHSTRGDGLEHSKAQVHSRGADRCSDTAKADIL